MEKIYPLFLLFLTIIPCSTSISCHNLILIYDFSDTQSVFNWSPKSEIKNCTGEWCVMKFQDSEGERQKSRMDFPLDYPTGSRGCITEDEYQERYVSFANFTENLHCGRWVGSNGRNISACICSFAYCNDEEASNKTFEFYVSNPALKGSIKAQSLARQVNCELTDMYYHSPSFTKEYHDFNTSGDVSTRGQWCVLEMSNDGLSIDSYFKLRFSYSADLRCQHMDTCVYYELTHNENSTEILRDQHHYAWKSGVVQCCCNDYDYCTPQLIPKATRLYLERYADKHPSSLVDCPTSNGANQWYRPGTSPDDTGFWSKYKHLFMSTSITSSKQCEGNRCYFEVKPLGSSYYQTWGCTYVDGSGKLAICGNSDNACYSIPNNKTVCCCKDSNCIEDVRKDALVLIGLEFSVFVSLVMYIVTGVLLLLIAIPILYCCGKVCRAKK